MKFRALQDILKENGFYLVRVSGSHHLYDHDKLKLMPLINIQPDKNRDAKPYQIRQVQEKLEVLEGLGN